MYYQLLLEKNVKDILSRKKERKKQKCYNVINVKVTFSFTPQSFLGGFKYYCFCYDCLHKTLPVSKGSGNIIEKHFIVKDLFL